MGVNKNGNSFENDNLLKSKRKELKYTESAIQEKLQKLDYLICNNLDLSKQTLDEFEEGKKSLKTFSKKKAKKQFFDQNPVGWKGVKNLQDISLTLRKGTTRKKLFYSLRLEAMK